MGKKNGLGRTPPVTYLRKMVAQTERECEIFLRMVHVCGEISQDVIGLERNEGAPFVVSEYLPILGPQLSPR